MRQRPFPPRWSSSAAGRGSGPRHPFTQGGCTCIFWHTALPTRRRRRTITRQFTPLKKTAASAPRRTRHPRRLAGTKTNAAAHPAAASHRHLGSKPRRKSTKSGAAQASVLALCIGTRQAPSQSNEEVVVCAQNNPQQVAASRNTPQYAATAAASSAPARGMSSPASGAVNQHGRVAASATRRARHPLRLSLPSPRPALRPPGRAGPPPTPRRHTPATPRRGQRGPPPPPPPVSFLKMKRERERDRGRERKREKKRVRATDRGKKRKREKKSEGECLAHQRARPPTLQPRDPRPCPRRSRRLPPPPLRRQNAARPFEVELHGEENKHSQQQQ